MKFYFGVDYYPEHWEKNRWKLDVEMMKDAGFNYARLAEFAWSRLEPEEGHFDFSWLDEIITILSKKWIKTVLGTPTAAPPAWLIEKHREILPIDENGISYEFGGRLHRCLNNKIFYQYTEKIVKAMAKHYGKNPDVIGWQIDNELGAPYCYCKNCQLSFQKWLKEKHKTIENLNKEWGTVFWSQEYQNFHQIPLPKKNPANLPNPSLSLDFYRFFSSSNIIYLNFQVDILRRIISHEQFITTNLWGCLDHYEMCKKLDFASWDNYPGLSAISEPAREAFHHSIFRGYKRKNFWVLEQRSGQPGSTKIYSPEARPGQIRLWTYQSIAQGADGVSYFRWRTCRFGQEQYWHGILNHDGLPNRRYTEVKKIGEEISRVGKEIVGKEIQSKVALIFMWNIFCAFSIQPHHDKFDYGHFVFDFYKPFWRLGIPTDVLPRVEKLDSYKLVVAPALFLMSSEIVKNLKKYVENGGTLLLTFRSGVKNWNNIVTEKQLPGDLADLAGIFVKEYDIWLEGNNFIKAPFISSKLYPAKVWCDIIETGTAKTLATYTKDYYAGTPCVTVNNYGKGKVYYLGTSSDKEFYFDFMRKICKEARIEHIISLQDGIEVTKRGDIIFVLNHNDKMEKINLSKGKYHDLITGKKISGRYLIKPKEVIILKEMRQ